MEIKIQHTVYFLPFLAAGLAFLAPAFLGAGDLEVLRLVVVFLGAGDLEALRFGAVFFGAGEVEALRLAAFSSLAFLRLLASAFLMNFSPSATVELMVLVLLTFLALAFFGAGELEVFLLESFLAGD